MTRREQILAAVYALAVTVPGIAASSITRERAAPIAESECPALDLAPESEPDPQSLGASADQRNLTVVLKIYTAGNSAYSLADPILQALHAKLYLDQTLGGLASMILSGSTDFARDQADQIIGQTTLRYVIVYFTRVNDQSLAP